MTRGLMLAALLLFSACDQRPPSPPAAIEVTPNYSVAYEDLDYRDVDGRGGMMTFIDPKDYGGALLVSYGDRGHPTFLPSSGTGSMSAWELCEGPRLCLMPPDWKTPIVGGIEGRDALHNTVVVSEEAAPEDSRCSIFRATLVAETQSYTITTVCPGRGVTDIRRFEGGRARDHLQLRSYVGLNETEGSH